MKRKILMVDDDQTLLHMTRALLERDGYEVHTHASAFGTEELLRRLAPHLMLLDVNMPALSGDRLVGVLRASQEKVAQRVPIIFYSAIDEPRLRSLTQTHGVQGYVCKGNPTELRACIERCLAASEAEAVGQ